MTSIDTRPLQTNDNSNDEAPKLAGGIRTPGDDDDDSISGLSSDGLTCNNLVLYREIKQENEEIDSERDSPQPRSYSITSDANQRLNFSVIVQICVGKVNIKTNELDFNQINEVFNQTHQPISIINETECVANINKYFVAIDEILQDTLRDIGQQAASKFDLKTASTLLPVMSDCENVTKHLIDPIKFYDQILNDDGKMLLTQYVLATRNSQKAKLCLANSYASNADLIQALRENFLTKKSATSLASQLQTARQANKSISDFGKSIEELLYQLTITQADNNAAALNILQTVNEQSAINAFANGLNSS
ncbi:hypothetical protein FQR65_LT16175 [Abscondita terminalis]|nr:hypothetical protein FQR65_LT16175 [Abscondita terminalis]